MKRAARLASAWAALCGLLLAPSAHGYVLDYTNPSAGGCPQPNHFNTVGSATINRQWSASLPATQTIFTVAPPGSSAQLDEIQQTIEDSFGAWAGVTSTTLNSTNFPTVLGPLGSTTTQDACENDQGTNLDGLNSICFNQSSAAFTTGVLAFTRIVTADAPGITLGSSGPAAFVGQILQASTLVRNDGRATFATPGALANHPSSYDLESILIHELGHFFGLDHSAVWRAAMFPFAPAPGTILGIRPTTQAPDAPLADDDRAGLRLLYPDPTDTLNTGVILGHIIPANPLSLALLLGTSAGQFVTGVFGGHVVAVNATTGAVVAGALGGWSCDPNNPPAHFDGSYQIQRLPLGLSYNVYAEPLNGVVLPGDLSNSTGSACAQTGPTPCTPPPVNTDFVAHLRPAP